MDKEVVSKKEEVNGSPDYVRVKINHSRENKVKGFYLLMTNGNTYSDKLDEFVVEKKFLKLLKENNIHFESLPINT